MKLFSKIISASLCAIMLFSAVSCGGKTEQTDDGVQSEILTYAPSEDDMTDGVQTTPEEVTEDAVDSSTVADTSDADISTQEQTGSSVTEDVTSQYIPETTAPVVTETQTPQTQAPQTQAPQTQAPQTQAPQTQAPQTQAPQTQAPQVTPPVTVKQTTQTPKVLGVYNCAPDRVIIFGSCEKGSTITSWGKDGVKEHNVSGNGYFYVEQSATSPAQTVTLTATVPGKYQSSPITAKAQYNANAGMTVFGGRDSRLFMQATLPFYLGQVKANDSVLNAAKQYVSNLRQTVCSYTGKDTKFIYVIAPNPATVYYDGVRDYILNAVSGKQQQTAAWQFVNKMQGVDGFIVPDLYTKFGQVRNQDIFYRTDTHWSELGAFYAYAEMIPSVKNDFPKTPVYSLNNFDVVYEDCWGGDFAAASFLNAGNLRETVPFLYPKFSEVGAYYTARRQSGKSVGVAVSVYPTSSSIGKSDLASCYFIGDSYGANFLPFAGMSFGKMYANEGVMWNYTLDANILKTYKPDYVMFVYTDRNIDSNLAQIFSTTVKK